MLPLREVSTRYLSQSFRHSILRILPANINYDFVLSLYVIIKYFYILFIENSLHSVRQTGNIVNDKHLIFIV